MQNFSTEEIDAMNEFMTTGRDKALTGRFDRIRALGFMGYGDSINERGLALKQHLFEALGMARQHEDAVNRFEMLERNPSDRADAEAELFRLGLGYRCQDGRAVLNGWGQMIDDRWRIANR